MIYHICQILRKLFNHLPGLLAIINKGPYVIFFYTDNKIWHLTTPKNTPKKWNLQMFAFNPEMKSWEIMGLNMCWNCAFWCERNKYQEGSFWCALENQYCSWAAFTISVCRSVKVSANKFASHSGFQLWKKPKSRKYKSTFCTTKCQWFQKNTKAQRPPMLICFRSQSWKERKKYLLSTVSSAFLTLTIKVRKARFP